MSLLTLLRHRHVEALVSDAETIRGWHEPAERMNAAQRHLNNAMYERAVGRITDGELEQISRLLSFAIEPVSHPPRDAWNDLASVE